jgi:3-phosphoshikimate 1-carboxyvinyltransferase
MLISTQNILGGQLSAISSRHLEIELPLSKSESNRALMIMHYAELQNLETSKPQSHSNSATQQFSNLVSLSNSDDTVLLQKHLNTLSGYVKNPSTLPLTLDCRNAGTVFRFLMTAVANLHLGDLESRCLRVLLTGSERMKSRPISSLVEALRSLGISIEYTEKEGYPPVLLTVNAVNRQQTLSTTLCPTLSTLNSLEISAEQSSQFASSLLLAAPLWKNGLALHLTGNLSSLPYIDMTINMMRQCGINVSRDDRDITVKHGIYNIDNIKVEPDWSAAAFWYEMVSLSDGAEVLLKNHNINSLQADATAIKMFENLGVETIAAKDGVVVKKVNSQQSMANSQSSTFNFQLSTFNFKDCPDLFPAVIAACAGNRVNATFSGLKNLSIKESDRKQAMMNELMKINITFENVSDDELKMFCPEVLPCFTEENPIIFNNYEDHRVAMALSVLTMKIGTISMENVEVVSKSYPEFFRLQDYKSISR